MEMEEKSVLNLLTKEDEKPLETRKPSPCAEKTETIRESLRKIKEQIDAIPILDLTGIQEQLTDIKSSIGTLITLMEKKVDMDALEATVLNMLKDKMETG